jgi:hypothetical protein
MLSTSSRHAVVREHERPALCGLDAARANGDARTGAHARSCAQLRSHGIYVPAVY